MKIRPAILAAVCLPGLAAFACAAAHPSPSTSLGPVVATTSTPEPAVPSAQAERAPWTTDGGCGNPAPHAQVAFAVPAPKAAQCVVHQPKASVARIRVQPADGFPAFDVTAHEVPAVVTIGADPSAPVHVAVGGGFAFEGDALVTEYYASRRFVGAQGMVLLSEGARLTSVHARDDTTALASLVPMIVPVVSGFDVPCDALSVDQRLDASVGGIERTIEPGPGAILWELLDPERGATLFQFPGSGGGRGVALHLASAGPDHADLLELQQLDVSGSWIHVRASYAASGTFSGWVARAEVTPGEYRPSGIGESGCGYSCGGGVRLGDIGCIGAGCVPAHYQGRGAVRAGTRVFAAPGKGEWSSVAAAAEMAVVFDRGSEWIRISPDDITEECEPLSHGFVRAGDVRLPWQP